MCSDKQALQLLKKLVMFSNKLIQVLTVRLFEKDCHGRTQLSRSSSRIVFIINICGSRYKQNQGCCLPILPSCLMCLKCFLAQSNNFNDHQYLNN